MDVASLPRHGYGATVKRFTKAVQQPQTFGRHRNMARRARIINRRTPARSGTPMQRARAYMVLTQVLMHLEQTLFIIEAAIQDLAQRR